MYVLRNWSVRNARALEWVYARFSKLLVLADPAFRLIGYDRLEKPVAAVEATVKGLLFDCRMCGQCILSKTGMSCPMNCPKSLRNGPCGGVRTDGNCEVKPDMRCVWVAAFEGAARMSDPAAIRTLNPPLDRSLEGRSSWLRETRETVAAKGSLQTRPAPADAKDMPT